LRLLGITADDIDASLLVENAARCSPPLDDTEVTNIARSVSRYEPAPVAEVKTYPATDVGNAELFADVHGRDCRYVGDWRSWIVWDGRRWKRDTTETVRRRAVELARHGMTDVARNLAADDERAKYLKHVAASQARNRIDNMVSLAQTYLAIEARELDRHPWLFNLANGTLDLNTGTLRPHDRGDMLTKISPVEFDAAATSPTWDRFTRRIFQSGDGDARPELERYIQTAAGFTLTGDVSEHALFLLHGTGRNGKTTFIDALKFIMGEYALTAQQQLLIAQRHKNNSEDEANLFGVRFAVVSETNEGQRFDESTVKRLIGGGKVRARRLYENSFEFDPSHKIWMDCNHLPAISGTDLGIWRRVKRVPFDSTILAAEVDAKLPDKLRAEAAGILNWMLAGLALYRAEGLNEPAEVRQAVRDYQTSSDVFGQFLEECTLDSPAERVESAAIYMAYRMWCKRNGIEHPLTQIRFGHKLRERRYEPERTKHGRYWRGLSLTDEQTAEPFADPLTDDRWA
jgi:putative DNA primase/helicase